MGEVFRWGDNVFKRTGDNQVEQLGSRFDDPRIQQIYSGAKEYAQVSQLWGNDPTTQSGVWKLNTNPLFRSQGASAIDQFQNSSPQQRGEVITQGPDSAGRLQVNSNVSGNLYSGQNQADQATKFGYSNVADYQKASAASPQPQYYSGLGGAGVQGNGTVLGANPAPAPTAAGASPTAQPTNLYGASSYGGPSIVDYLKSKNQATDFASRTALAGQNGIQNYTGTAGQNTQLLGILRGMGAAPTTPAKPAGVLSANQATRSLAGEGVNFSGITPTSSQVSSPQNFQGFLQEMRQNFQQQQAQAPNRVALMNTLRGQQGVVPIEDELAQLKGEQDKLQTDLSTFSNTEQDQGGQTAGFTQGRISEQQALVQNKMYGLQRREAILTDRLQTKNNYINTVVSLTGQDYADAKDLYDTQFNQAMQMYSLYSNEQDKQKSEVRANLDSIINMAQASGLNFNDLMTQNPVLGMKVNEYESQLGYSPGTFETLMQTNPTGKIVMNGVSADETKGFALMQMPDGSFKTYNFATGLPYHATATAGNAEDKTLTPSEAISLGVPYGTTRSEAYGATDPAVQKQNALDTQTVSSNYQTIQAIIAKTGKTPETFTEEDAAKLQDPDVISIGKALARMQNPDIARQGAEAGNALAPTSWTEKVGAFFRAGIGGQQYLPSKILQGVQTANALMKQRQDAGGGTAPQQTGGQTTQTTQTIRVRRKSDGQVGTIPISNFSDQLYEKL